MNRRETLLALLALGAASQAARAQQAGGIARIGVLLPATPEPFASRFREAMRKLGYEEGRNVLIEVRTAEGDSQRFASLAAELVRLRVDVIVAAQTPAVSAAKQATQEIPIVMSSAADPVGTGLIASLARPGGNVTGASGPGPEIAAKALEFIREIIPSARRVSVLANATDPFTKLLLATLENAGRALALEISPFAVRKTGEFAAAFQEMVRRGTDAVFVQPSLQRKAAAELALKHRLPTVSFVASFPDEGGLLAYSADNADQVRRSADYVDRILKGARPADLPVQQATRFDLAVNLKTARALGIRIPQSVLIRTDRVID